MSAPAIGLTRAEAPQAAGAGFFERDWPVRLILASFLLLTLPLAALSIQRTSLWIVGVYGCLLGTTHFVVTVSIYLRGENLEYFRSSARNRLIYFGIPVAIFLSFYVVGAFSLVAAFPVFGMCFQAAVKLFNFNHLNRQSFGVLQLFQARAGVRAPVWLKRAQNWFFMVLTALLLATYLGGGRLVLLPGSGPAHELVSLAILRPATLALMAIGTALLAVVVAGMAGAWKKLGASGLFESLAYLVFQAASAVLAVFSTPLLTAALAMHYVEYHVLMYPRCLDIPLNEANKPDRWMAWLRASKARFYGTLVAVSVAVYALTISSLMIMDMAPAASPRQYLFVLSVLDGLFVFHYFVEMYIWRFNEPFFRRTLGALYFSRR